jgi:hypothetical protein
VARPQRQPVLGERRHTALRDSSELVGFAKITT